MPPFLHSVAGPVPAELGLRLRRPHLQVGQNRSASSSARSAASASSSRASADRARRRPECRRRRSARGGRTAAAGGDRRRTARTRVATPRRGRPNQRDLGKHTCRAQQGLCFCAVLHRHRRTPCPVRCRSGIRITAPQQQPQFGPLQVHAKRRRWRQRQGAVDQGTGAIPLAKREERVRGVRRQGSRRRSVRRPTRAHERGPLRPTAEPPRSAQGGS